MAELHFLSLPVWLREILTDPFKKHLVLFLCFLGLGIYITEQYLAENVDSTDQQVVFFFHRQCPHCQKQKKFNPYLKAKYPELNWAEYGTSIQENVNLLAAFVQRLIHSSSVSLWSLP